MYSTESSGSFKMVTNAELEKKVDEQKNLLEEKTRILDEALEEVKDNLKEIEDATQVKEDEDFNKGKEKVSLDNEIPKPDPPLGEKEPFLKALKAFGGKKYRECVFISWKDGCRGSLRIVGKY